MKKLLLLLFLCTTPMVGVAQDLAQLFEPNPNSNITPWFAGSGAVGDFNSDGLEDFVRQGFTQFSAIDGIEFGSVIGFRNPDNSFTEVPNVIFDSNQGQIIVGDIDGDGDLDIFNIGQTINSPPFDPNAGFYINDGDGNFTLSLDNDIPGLYFSSAAFADTDNDGDLDLAVQGSVRNQQTNAIEIYFRTYLNNGSGIFSLNYETSGLTAGDLRAAHLNNDNLVDFFSSGEGLNGVSSFRFINNGSDFDNETGNADSINGSNPTGDIDGDGDIDLVSTGSNGTPVGVILKNDGNGNLSQFGTISAITVSECQLTDVRGNGVMALIAAGESQAGIKSVRLYDNDGNGTFTLMFNILPSVSSATILTFSNGDVLITGDQSQVPLSSPSMVYLRSTSLEDFDGDGTPNGIDPDWQDPDVDDGVCGDFDPNNSVWLLGDYDGDSYSNGDELDFGSDPCDPQSIILGINAINLDSQVVLYPNPVTNLVNLKIPTNVRIENLTVFNMLGQVIDSGNHNVIDVSHLAAGQYFIQIQFDDGIAIKQFVKE